MNDQYFWLYKNVDRYTYNTDKARTVLEGIKSMVLSEDVEPTKEEQEKLQKFYTQFIGQFNNDPFSYKTGLVDAGIETNDFDCYFIESTDGLVPIGYYKEIRPVESVIMLNQQVTIQSDEAKEKKSKIMLAFRREAKTLSGKYAELKRYKKANIWRAVVVAVLFVLVILNFVSFLKISNIGEIIKCIGKGQLFTNAIDNAMYSMPLPFLEGGGTFVWFLMLIVHLIFVLIVICNIKKLYNEFKMAIKRISADNIENKIEARVKTIETRFPEIHASQTAELLEVARQGNPHTIEKSPLARITKGTRDIIARAKAYLNIPVAQLASIKGKKLIVFLLIFNIIGLSLYSVCTIDVVNQKINNVYYTSMIEKQGKKLKALKIAKPAVGDGITLYSRPTEQSIEVAKLAYTDEMQIIAEDDSGAETWVKVLRFSGDKVIKGWVQRKYVELAPAKNLLPIAAMSIDIGDVENGKMKSIVDDSEIYTMLDGVEHVPNNMIDWNPGSMWIDINGNCLLGKGNEIKISFNQKSTIDVLCFSTGNTFSEVNFRSFSRIKEVKITFNNSDNKEQSIKHKFDDFYSQYQTITLSKPVLADSITIEILSTYDGAENNHLCIAEIQAYTTNREN